MNSNLTDITLIVDRSGSMHQYAADSEGGINNFIREQKATEGDAKLSLVDFNSRPSHIISGEDLKTLDFRYTMRASGNTALYDTVGDAIQQAGRRLDAMQESDKPGLVLFAIVTDGADNASTRHTAQDIRQMIEHQTNVYKWQFVYLGANQDAFKESQAIGISALSAANYAAGSSGAAYSVMSRNVTAARRMRASGQSGSMSFSAADRQELV
jgi:uncharacterized protein YegL